MPEQQSTERHSEVLQMIATDMADAASAFDGSPFIGRTVAEYMANQGAAIAAMAKITAALLPAIDELKDRFAALTAAANPAPVDTDQQARIAGYLADAEHARIDLTEISPEVKVSTMWISGHNRRYIETMILGGNLAGYTVERNYMDEDDAQAGHNAVVAALREGIVPDGLVGE